nr:hypothetical protein [Desulfobacula sp.]
MKLADEHHQILDKIQELYREIFLHDGFGELKIEMKFLRKKQKEIIIRCGKDFRYVVDYDILPGSGGSPAPKGVMAGVNPVNT